VIEFKHILCPIDFSDTSMRALTYAAALATWYEAQLEVLHVVPAFEDGLPPAEPGGNSDPRRPGSREAIIAAIQRSLREAGASGLNAKVLAQEGRAHELIAYRAQAQPADLLVMGTHGRGGFNRLLLGSITEKVLRTVRCPVLTVPQAAPAMRAAAVTFKQILSAIDYSPSALEALQICVGTGTPGRRLRHGALCAGVHGSRRTLRACRFRHPQTAPVFHRSRARTPACAARAGINDLV
jgi:nucleotide-binding universal stress UspA family protein